MTIGYTEVFIALIVMFFGCGLFLTGLSALRGIFIRKAWRNFAKQNRCLYTDKGLLQEKIIEGAIRNRRFRLEIPRPTIIVAEEIVTALYVDTTNPAGVIGNIASIQSAMDLKPTGCFIKDADSDDTDDDADDDFEKIMDSPEHYIEEQNYKVSSKHAVAVNNCMPQEFRNLIGDLLFFGMEIRKDKVAVSFSKYFKNTTQADSLLRGVSDFLDRLEKLNTPQ